MFKKLILVLAVLLLLSGCTKAPSTENDKISIVSSIFASYDFARALAEDKADIKMLVKPGVEVHTFEPTPQDIIAIQNCDIFIYIGGESDKWIADILSSVDTSGKEIISLMEVCETVTEEIKEGMQAEEDHLSIDEHVWTSPKNAMSIVDVLCEKLCAKDPENAEFYKNNRDSYKSELIALDSEFEKTVASSKRKTLVFGDRFPLRYFTERYLLDYYAAFPGCTADAEPSAGTVAFLINKIKEEKIPVVFYIEMSNMKMADILCEETGAKKMLFSSCHNITAKEFESGVTYLELMQNNLSALKEALN